MTDKLTVFVCGRGPKRKMKKWVATVHDVNGFLIKTEKVEAATYDEAFGIMLEAAQSIKGAFMVHIGLGQRMVKA